MSGTGRKTGAARPDVTDLQAREEQYKRLNAELEAKTASLVQEADAVLRRQAAALAAHPTPPLLDNVSSDDLSVDWNPAEHTTAPDGKTAQQQAAHSKPSTSHTKPPQRKVKKTVGVGPTPRSGRSGSAASSAHEDAYIMKDDRASELSLHAVIANVERRLDEGSGRPRDKGAGRDPGAARSERAGHGSEEDVMPAVATEMGAEAQIRFLKAKLRVTQEELGRVTGELGARDEALRGVQAGARGTEEERARLERRAGVLQAQADKHKKLWDEARSKADSTELQLGAVKKELDALKREQKQQVSNQSAAEVRLARALEEAERSRAELARVRAESREGGEGERRRVEQLVGENRRLEKQKAELLSGFRKQLRLIDVLQRQRMHVEATRLLAFTEDEFIKALEWTS